MRIELKPMSVNKAWQGKRYKTNDYKQFQKDMMLLLPKVNLGFKGKLSIDIVFGFSSTRSDIDNPLKPTIDTLQKKYGFDDKQIYKLNVTKEIVKKGNEFMDLKISEL